MTDLCKVTILHEGYFREPAPKQYEAGCTLVLIQLTGSPATEQIDPTVLPQIGSIKNILFEAGGPWEAASIIAKLADHNLTCDDIDLLVCSHGHSDHVGCLSLFPKGLGSHGVVLLFIFYVQSQTWNETTLLACHWSAKQLSFLDPKNSFYCRGPRFIIGQPFSTAGNWVLWPVDWSGTY